MTISQFLKTRRFGNKGLTISFGESSQKVDFANFADVQFSGATLQVGDEIVVAGFPLSTPYLIVQRGIVSAIPIEPIIGTAGEREDIVMDAMVNPGNSGGPVFLASNGCVVGVCRAQRLAPILEMGMPHDKLVQNAGLSFATPSKPLLAMLEKHTIKHKIK
jgi:S1-C subfamily serine protease